MRGKHGRMLYWSKTIYRLFLHVATPEEKFQHIFDFYELISAVGPAIFLIINNVLLVLTVGVIMAISTDMLSLVQNFIAVEILVHVHEMIPPLMRLQDRSPHRFNKNWREVNVHAQNVRDFYLQLYVLGTSCIRENRCDSCVC